MKNIIKYILLAVFVFMQVQAFAFNNSSDLWKKVSLKEETNWLLFSNKFDLKSDKTVYFFIDGQYFSLVCLNDTYYRGGDKIVYRLKNIGIQDIKTVDKINIGVKFQVSKTNLGDIIGGINESLFSSPLNLSAIYLDVGESVDFSFIENAPSSVSEGQTATFTLTLTYGSAGSSLSISNSNRLEALTLNTVLTKNSNLPVVLSAQIFPNIQYTLQEALGLSDSQLLGKTFYKNGVVFNPKDLLSSNKILTQDDINDFTYSVDGSSLKSKVLLYFPYNFPYGGQISSSSPFVNNKYQVCYDGTITINESQAAISYRSRAFKYTWEFSYDGIKWEVYGDSQETEGETADIGNKTLSINNLKRDILVRRKVHEMITTVQVNWYSYSNVISINVVNPVVLYDGKSVNDTPKGNNGIAKVVGSEIEFPVFTVRNANGIIDPLAKITIYDEQGLKVAQNYTDSGSGNGTLTIPNRTFSTKGFYKYKIVIQESSGLQCLYTEYYNVAIYEPADCNKYTKKIFATITSDSQVGVVDELLAADKDLSTKSTISAALTALYLGPRQKVLFDTADFPGVSGAPIKAGTTIKIKLGQEYSGLNIAGGISLYPLNDNNSRIGLHVDAVEGALLDLLVGDNIFEYSYVAPVDLYGVEVYVGGLVGAAVNASLYGIYIEREENIISNTTNHCFGGEEIKGAALPLSTTIYNNVDTGEPITFPADGIIRLNSTVSDVCWGVQDVGLGVATALASVVYPYLAVDDSYETYAIFNKTVAALNRQFLDVSFNQLGRQGDQIQILLSNSGIDILSLNLLADFKAQRYLGDTPVGDEISLNNTALVKLSLAWIDGKRRAAIIVPSDVPFDRVRLTYLSVVQVSLGDYTYIHDVSLLPKMYFEGFNDSDETVMICAAEPLFVEKMEACTNYDISIAYKNNQNEFVDISNSALQLKPDLQTINGRDFYRYEFSKLYNEYSNLYFKVQSYRKGCLFGETQYFSIDLKNCTDAIVNPVIRTTTKN